MTEVAAIDRIVHNAIIIEMVGGSLREDKAQGRLARIAAEDPTTTLESPAHLVIPESEMRSPPLSGEV